MWTDQELRELFLKNTPLIDVRAPVEYLEGAIPNSRNLPIMDNEERRLVGTCYKEHGQERAIKLGHELVSGDIKEARISAWEDFIRRHPETEVFCFRGGLRSQISCQWLKERKLEKKPISGGYKRLRQFFLSYLEAAPLPLLWRLGGFTGSGKTTFLQSLPHKLDLEKIANHRGSAFGPRGDQPSQVTFENNLALELMRQEGRKVIVEDESAVIGKVIIPRRLFTTLRAAPLIILDTLPEERLQNIFEEYVKTSSVEFFVNGVGRIQKKLGQAKTQLLMEEIKKAFASPLELRHHETWISILLKEYYDPLYLKDLRYNQEKIVFRGNSSEVFQYISSL